MSTSTKTKGTPNWARLRKRNGHIYVTFDRSPHWTHRKALRDAGYEWKSERGEWRALRNGETLRIGGEVVKKNNVEYWVEKRGFSPPDWTQEAEEAPKTTKEASNGKKAVESRREPQNGNGNLGSQEFLPLLTALLEGVTITKGDLKEALREVLREEGVIATRSF